MAITSNDPRNPKLIPTHGVPEVVYGLLEADSQSFKAGELVYLSSGAVTVYAGRDAPVFGIALKDGTNVTSGNTEIPVALIRPDDMVLIQVEDGSGNLEASNTTCVPGTAYDIIVSSNHHRIDSSDTTNPAFVFVGEVLDATGAATYWGKFRPYYIENQVTSL